MSLRLDPRGRSIKQVIADLTKTADQLRPTDPRAAKLAEMIRGLQKIEAENPASSSGSGVTETSS